MDGGLFSDIEATGFTGSEEIEQRDYHIAREMKRLVLNLDFHADSKTEYFLCTLVSDHRSGNSTMA